MLTVAGVKLSSNNPVPVTALNGVEGTLKSDVYNALFFTHLKLVMLPLNILLTGPDNSHPIDKDAPPKLTLYVLFT